MGRARGWEIVERAKAGERLVFDGGYGTALFAAGLSNGACPELWNDTHPDIVRDIHKGYFDAGSDFVETNTFGGTRLKLNEYQIGDRTRELNLKGAQLARSVCAPGRYIAGSIGPTSRLPVEYEPHDYFRFTRHGAEHLLRRAGLEPIEFIPVGGLWARVGLSMIGGLNRLNRGPTRVLTEVPVRLLYVALQLGFELLDRLFLDPREVLAHLVVARRAR